MIHPAPTTAIDPSLARGSLAEIHIPAGQSTAHVVLTFPNTNYRTLLSLVGPHSAISDKLHKRIIGLIALSARRVDVVETGGKYIEPVFGRPRRVQGRIISTDRHTNSIIVDASIPIHVRLTDSRQHAQDFPLGKLVSFDAIDDATFTPAP